MYLTLVTLCCVAIYQRQHSDRKSPTTDKVTRSNRWRYVSQIGLNSSVDLVLLQHYLAIPNMTPINRPNVLPYI